ncbi:hypothetical protein TNCV_4483031 [Trichonephila clavipes]|nr:hypothetical protein TNCV_4483031 [Trichonephila clavipes]
MTEKMLKGIHMPKPKVDDNIAKLGIIVQSDGWLNFRVIAETVGIDKECVRQVLLIKFGNPKMHAEIMPEILTFEQQEALKNVGT